MSEKFTEEQTEKQITKEKVLSAEIIVTGTVDKPYYEIKYFDLSDGQYHVGYSSYDLKNVVEWRKECFEMVGEDECRETIIKQAEELREIPKKVDNAEFIPRLTLLEKILQAADTIEALSVKLSAESDLVRREDVMATVERVCKQYNMGFDTNSTKSGWFSADLPKAIMEIPAVDLQRKDGAK